MHIPAVSLSTLTDGAVLQLPMTVLPSYPGPVAAACAHRCVRYVKLFTNHNNTVLVGTHGNNATLATPQRYKLGVSLLAIRGFQDRAISHGEWVQSEKH